GESTEATSIKPPRKQRASDYYPLLEGYFRQERDHFLPGLTPAGPTRVPWDNFYYGSYNRFYSSVAANPDVLEAVLGAKKLFLHSKLDYANPGDFLADSASEPLGSAQPAVETFDGNTLTVDVNAAQACYLSWIDNDDPGWSAELDGRRVPIQRLFSTFKSVALPSPGRHVVSFRYVPAIPRWAWVGGAAGAVLALGAGLDARRRNGRP